MAIASLGHWACAKKSLRWIWYRFAQTNHWECAILTVQAALAYAWSVLEAAVITVVAIVGAQKEKQDKLDREERVAKEKKDRWLAAQRQAKDERDRYDREG